MLHQTLFVGALFATAYLQTATCSPSPTLTSCQTAGSACENGGTCTTALSCSPPVQLGATCDETDFRLCAPGLKCASNICTEKPGESAVIPRRGLCTTNVNGCAAGLVCAGKQWRKRCVHPRAAGKKCGSTPFRICASGLSCTDGRCVVAEETRPPVPRIAGRWEDCTGSGIECTEGTICTPVYNPRGNICVRQRKEGESCKYHSFAKCATGLLCVAGKCEPEGRGSY